MDSQFLISRYQPFGFFADNLMCVPASTVTVIIPSPLRTSVDTKYCRHMLLDNTRCWYSSHRSHYYSHRSVAKSRLVAWKRVFCGFCPQLCSSCQLRSKLNGNYSDLYKENFGMYEGAQIRALGRPGRILSPGPSAREAQEKRFLVSYPSPGRTFHSIRGAGERGGRRLLMGRKGERNLDK